MACEGTRVRQNNFIFNDWIFTDDRHNWAHFVIESDVRIILTEINFFNYHRCQHKTTRDFSPRFFFYHPPDFSRSSLQWKVFQWTGKLRGLRLNCELIFKFHSFGKFIESVCGGERAALLIRLNKAFLVDFLMVERGKLILFTLFVIFACRFCRFKAWRLQVEINKLIQKQRRRLDSKK